MGDQTRLGSAVMLTIVALKNATAIYDIKDNVSVL